MTSPLAILLFLMLWATLVRGLAARARVGRPTCARCGRAVERAELGERICNCGR